MSWDQMYTDFTTLNPFIRFRVLSTIGDLDQVIGTGNWQICLFAVAANAAKRLEPRSQQWVCHSAAAALGLRVSKVETGVVTWDSGTNEERLAFRMRIREFVQREYPVTEYLAEPQINQQTEGRIVLGETTTLQVPAGILKRVRHHVGSGVAVGIIAVVAMFMPW